MKSTLLGMAMAICCLEVKAQQLEFLLTDTTTQTPVRLIHRYRTLQKTPIGRPKMLISWYSWKNQVKSDFSSLTGLNNSGTIGKFAALNVNANTSSFSFSPIVTNGGDPVTGSFKAIHSVDFSGTVDKSNVLDLKKWKSTSLSYSFTYLFSPKYFFLDTPRGTPKHKPLDSEYKSVYDELEKQFILDFRKTRGNTLSALNHPEYADSLELRQAWLDSVAKYEKKLVSNSWTAKQFIWIKLTGTALSFDNADYLVKGDIASYFSPKSNVTYTPSLLLSTNYYFGLRSGLNFYVSAFVQGAIKNTFSEVMTTSVWNKVDPLTDSVMLNSSTKNTYILGSDHVQKKLLPNVGAEGIVFFPPFKYLGLGIHISAAFNGLISDQATTSTGWLQNLQGGLIFSFKDKTGASTINLEPYYQNKSYIDYSLAREHLWGLKFSVPINRLF